MSEKQKNQPKRKVEWSFSFEEIGDRLHEMFGSWGEDVEVLEAQYSEPLGAATSAFVKLDHTLGSLNLMALADSENLIEADLRYVGKVEFEVEGDAEKRAVLRQPSRANLDRPLKHVFRAFTERDDLYWNIGLNPNVPLQLKIKGGVGPADLNLTGLQLTALTIKGAVGEVDLTLPVTDEPISVSLDGGVGQIRVIVPAGMSGDFKVKGGVGATDFVLPPNAALRVESTSGIGDVKLPGGLERVKGGSEFISKSGIWQTPGFDLADQKITIVYKGSVGRLKIEQHDIA